jgi:SAM-dependent methyltransferase
MPLNAAKSRIVPIVFKNRSDAARLAEFKNRGNIPPDNESNMNPLLTTKATTHETYTPGYTSSAVDFMSRRSADRQARFVLPLLKSGQRLLDIGCGPGTITVGLAKIVAPGEVTAIDLAESQLELARQRAAQNKIQNARFISGSIYELPFADNTFDVVFCHTLFEHLKEPVLALREIRRVLKPGGITALRSPDWGGFIVHPFTPAIKAGMDLFQKFQIANGGDVFAGRKLKDWALTAGFPDAKWAGSFDFHDDIVGISEFMASQLELHASKGDASLDRNTLLEYTTAFRQLPTTPGAIFAGAFGELIATKTV